MYRRPETYRVQDMHTLSLRWSDGAIFVALIKVLNASCFEEVAPLGPRTSLDSHCLETVFDFHWPTEGHLDRCRIVFVYSSVRPY
jgi:hypothetical protein